MNYHCTIRKTNESEERRGRGEALFVTPISSIRDLDLDVNECETLNGGCDHQCNNTVGSFHCKCRKGFFLHRNGTTCIGKFRIKAEQVNSCLRNC